MPRRARQPAPHRLRGYWELSQRPLQALVFLLPLMLVYELALPIYGADEVRGVFEDIMARRFLYRFFEWFGVFGYYLPGLMVVVVLLCWHLFRRDPWKLDPRLYALMLAESIALAVPLFVFLLALPRSAPLAAVAGSATGFGGPRWQAMLVFSVGAGIYEEFVFRLVVIALVHMIVVDVLSLSNRTGLIAAVAVSALTFALHHFLSDRIAYGTDKLVYYSVGGLYLAGVYLLRGFGIAAATHAMYDVLCVLVPLAHARG